MAIINSASPGSQINLLCMIYRVIRRNNEKLSTEELASLCAPSNLPALADHVKRFPENLKFWMHEAHQLWRECADKTLALTRVAQSDSPEAIAVVTNDALFAKPIDDIFGSEENDTESLFRTLGCLLASERFVLGSDKRINNSNLEQFFSESLPKHKPNDSEKGNVGRYGYFLGFLDRDGSGDYVVDPTRAIRGVLDRVFAARTILTVNDFLDGLATTIPLLDGGLYRQQIEAEMKGPISGDRSIRWLSRSLSVSLSRLASARAIGLEAASDDPNSWILQIGDRQRPVSTVQYFSSAVP